MKVPPRGVRLLLLPVTVAVVVAVAGALTAVLLVGLVVAPLGGRRRPLRIAAFGLVYCGMELGVLARGGASSAKDLLTRTPPEERDVRNDRLVQWALSTVLGAARRVLGFRVDVEAVHRDALDGDEPVLVLARHGGPGDSFALVHLLDSRYRRRTRIVAKDILQFDPAIDLLLNRRGCCFIVGAPDHAGVRAGQLSACTAALGAREALLLFPEGENWTPRRRARAIRRLRERRKLRAARAAEQMDNVLPPRPAGVAACLTGRPGVRVVIVAHSGLDRIVTVRQLWRHIPFRKPMTVCVWAASQAPTDEEEVAEWLTDEWRHVDEWIESRRSDQTARPVS